MRTQHDQGSTATVDTEGADITRANTQLDVFACGAGSLEDFSDASVSRWIDMRFGGWVKRAYRQGHCRTHVE